MLDNPSDEEYAVDISDDDAALGIRWLEIPEMEGTSHRRVRAAVRILSPYDILVKVVVPDDHVGYAHRRWGHPQTKGEPDIPEWHPINPPGVMFSFDDAAMFLQELQFQPHDLSKRVHAGIVGVKFEYHQL